MSANPNDPFNNPNPNEAPAAYGQEDFASPPPRRGGNRLLIGCLIAAVVGLLVCCGGGYLVIRFGSSMLADMIRAEVQDSPTIVEHIGDIQSLEMNIGAIGEEAQNLEPGQASPFVFDIVGDKGSGQLIVTQETPGGAIESAVLVLPSGERLPVELSDGTDELNDIEEELNNLEFNVDVEEPAAAETAP